MCLFERKLENPKYLPSEKNRGNVPLLPDERIRLIGVGCGWCHECRKKIANDWKIRLNEEYLFNNKVEFITLSFSPNAVLDLESAIKENKYKGINGNEIDVNILAAYAIRLYQERWRKKYKKAQRHFFVTELGHKNTERLHLHGLVWNTAGTNREEFREDIQKMWKYGNVYIGKYVNRKTINYITKYITKVDEYHKGYKQKTFVSKGMGLQYVKKMAIRHQWRGEKTIVTYKTTQGNDIGLPRYYKEKLWTEEQRELLWRWKLDKEEDYLDGEKIDISLQDDMSVREHYIMALTAVRERNKRAGYGDTKTINKKYIITDIMKMNHEEAINYNKEKLVKAKERRIIKRTEYWENGEEYRQELSKALMTEYYILGEYIGTTTEAERKRNAEMAEAAAEHMSLRDWRLWKKGIITKNERFQQK